MKKVIPEDAILIPDGAECAFQGMIFDVYQWPQKLFDGSEYKFEMLKRPDTVNVICIVGGKIVVIDEEQPYLGSRLSFPGGRVNEDDASVEAAAKREMLEETGLGFKNWRLVKVAQPYRKMEWFVYVLVAWDLDDERKPTPDPGEKIHVRPMDFADLKDLIMSDTDYLGESRDLFRNLKGLDDLLALPEFKGREVDR